MPQVLIKHDEFDRLPNICMSCGEPAEVRVEKAFSWQPNWIYWLLLLGSGPYFLLLFIQNRRVRLSNPFCRKHENHWVRDDDMFNEIFCIGGILFALGFGLANIEYSIGGFQPSFLVRIGKVLWMGIPIAYLALRSFRSRGRIHATEITESHDVTLANVHPSFGVALAAMRGPAISPSPASTSAVEVHAAPHADR